MRINPHFHTGRTQMGGEWAEAMREHFMGPGRRGRRFGRGHGGFTPSERGNLKYDVLAILAEGPQHGYEIMLAIEERRGFRPSPGSIYPALQMLDDGDFVSGREAEGKRIYAITEKGESLLRTHRDSPEGAEATSEESADVEVVVRGMRTLHGLKDAVKQLARSGDADLMKRGVDILSRARRELYALLAEEI
jgi:DNA-binding PadR family transcriptional regulator